MKKKILTSLLFFRNLNDFVQLLIIFSWLKVSLFAMKKLQNSRLVTVFLHFCKKNKVLLCTFFDLCQIFHSYSKYNGFPTFFFSLYFLFLFLSFFLKVQFLIFSSNLIYEERKNWWKLSFYLWMLSILIQVLKVVSLLVPVQFFPLFAFPSGFVNIPCEYHFQPSIQWQGTIQGTLMNEKPNNYWSLAMFSYYLELRKHDNFFPLLIKFSPLLMDFRNFEIIANLIIVPDVWLSARRGRRYATMIVDGAKGFRGYDTLWGMNYH